MANYVFIESRDPFESRDTDFVAESAGGLQRLGNDVVVFLVNDQTGDGMPLVRAQIIYHSSPKPT